MDIAFRSIRIESKSFEVPLFMDSSQNDALNEIIDNFENSVGQKEDEFDSNFIFEIFSDSKIAKGIYFILTKYFYDVKGLDTADLNAYELRLKLYGEMEQSGLTWASTRQQKQILTALSQNYNIGEMELTKNLFSDFSDNFKVIKRTDEKPSVDLVIRYYNTEIVKFLLSKSYILFFKLSNYRSKGNFVKNIIKGCKFLGIEYDLEVLTDTKEEQLLQVNLVGPNDLVGRNIKYSSNLFAFFIRNLVSQSQEVYDLFLEVQYFETRKQVFLPLQGFPSIVDDSQEEILYDSTIEKVFFEQWVSNFPHWFITREPLIIEKNLVMVPDFLLSYRNKSFYFEIVGFWTERYLTKKVMKVSLLKNKYPNMILLVDKSLDWPETQIPTFFYDKKVPVLEIGQFLKPFEEDELINIITKKNFDLLKSNIEQSLKKKANIFGKDLFDIFEVGFVFELDKYMEFLFKSFPGKISFVYFSKYIFISSLDFLFELQKTIAIARVNNKLSFQQLKLQYSFLDEKILKVLLTYIGYDFKYRSLLEEEMIFKKDKLIKSEII